MEQAETDRVTPTGPALDDYGRSDAEWLKVKWYEHLRQARIHSALGSTEFDYVEIGEGPPVLFVHGLGGSWRNWLENLVPFAENHRVVAIDLPGFGTSPLPDEPLTIKSMGDFVVSAADQLDLGPETALIGHSMGGFIATESVIEAPGRFSSLVLVAAAGISFATQGNTRRSVTRAMTKMVQPLLANRMDRGMSRRRLRAASFSGVIAHPSLIRRELLWELGSYAMTSPGLLEAGYHLSGYDSRERLPEIEIPTLVIWGRKDRLVPVRAAYSYAERIPDSRLSIIDDTGHMVQMERPDRFNREVEEFISEPAG